MSIPKFEELLANPDFQKALEQQFWRRLQDTPFRSYLRARSAYTFYLYPVEHWRYVMRETARFVIGQCQKCGMYFSTTKKDSKQWFVGYWLECGECRPRFSHPIIITRTVRYMRR